MGPDDDISALPDLDPIDLVLTEIDVDLGRQRLVERHASSAELLPRVGDFIAGLKAPLRGGS